MLRLRLSTERHSAFKPSPCLKPVLLPLNEQIFNTIDISLCRLASCLKASGSVVPKRYDK
ncbi:hypothetical protein AAEH72_00560 [Shewanella xiamenensis]|uniref:Uncharacterized protein n=1 Tax=Shewanella decolorationis TaxID=256839 RepID=A0A5B8R5Y7_9GAMM|nr:hypothetical protein [Shewanella decolorationis]